MEQSQRIKNAWVDQNKQIISFQRMNGAIVYTAREADFWQQILCWMRAGYRVQ